MLVKLFLYPFQFFFVFPAVNLYGHLSAPGNLFPCIFYGHKRIVLTGGRLDICSGIRAVAIIQVFSFRNCSFFNIRILTEPTELRSECCLAVVLVLYFSKYSADFLILKLCSKLLAPNCGAIIRLFTSSNKLLEASGALPVLIL